MADPSVSRLQRILAQLTDDVKKPVKNVTIKQAEILRGAMLVKVPHKSNKLRGSIRIEQSPRSEMRILVKAGGAATTTHGYDYAIAQEFGTQHNPAQPFFWPSYRAKRAAIRRAIKATILIAIDQNWHA